jgi:hypothetical protein
MGGTFNIAALSREDCARLRRLVARGKIPEGILTTDKDEAIYKLNKHELYMFSGRARMAADRLKFRRFVPRLADHQPTGVREFKPVSKGDYVDLSREEDSIRQAGIEHAQAWWGHHIARGIEDYAARLHVQYGMISLSDVREHSHQIVDQVCDRLEARIDPPTNTPLKLTA